MNILPVEIIKKKRNSFKLNKTEIEDFFKEFLKGNIKDYQVSALLMAVYFNGLDAEELANYTTTIIKSGKTFDLSNLKGYKIDKHSTGGVGDKVSLIVLPIIASLDIYIPMVSGRGLGHTGGTLDKLSSIPGFKTQLKEYEFLNILAKEKGVFGAQTKDFVPLDKLTYAIRDASGTVESIPLIAASIMSKKIAEGINGLVLDVKVGNGAFMKDEKRASILAETMIDIGKSHNLNVRAVLTDMNFPLGRTVGNALEVKEAIEYLQGNKHIELSKVVNKIVFEMLEMAGVKTQNIDSLIEESISSGKAINKLKSIIKAQGGDPSIVDKPNNFSQVAIKKDIFLNKDGFWCGCDTYSIGIALISLGGGRKKKEDNIITSTGIEFFTSPGQIINKKEPFARIYAENIEALNAAEQILLKSVNICKRPIERKLVIKTIK